MSSDTLRPSSLEELQGLVAAAAKIRVSGSGHSFNDIADTPGMRVSLDQMDTPLAMLGPGNTVTVAAGARYADLTARLDEHGLALRNLASLPHISVAGACATGTHGSGNANQNLATAARAIQLVRADGELVTLDRADDRFAGAVVALGALGVVVTLTLDLVPTYAVRQQVYEGMTWETVAGRVNEIFESGYSVSVFTDWHDTSRTQIWVKRRADDPRVLEPSLLGAQAADGPRHPITGLPAGHCTEQLGAPGPWHARMPHFRSEFTPSSAAELQSEYLVPRHHAAAAIAAVERVRAHLTPVLQVCELRTVAADDLWLSPQYGTDVLAIHFTWVKDDAAVRPVLGVIEDALARFDARPHWGKLFTTDPDLVRSRYPKLPNFAALAGDFDPNRTFTNDFVARYCFGIGAN